MNATSSSTAELLTGVVAAMPGVGVVFVGSDGGERARLGTERQLAWQGSGAARRPLLPPGCGSVSVPLVGGGCAVAVFDGTIAAGQVQLLHSVLCMVAKCEQLEQDMESMNHSSMQLLEQVSMLGETLPKLSAAESEAEIASTCLVACLVATSVQRAVYVRVDPRTMIAEVLVHAELDERGRATVRPYPLADSIGTDDGILRELLAGGEVVVLRAADQLTGNDEAAPERLAKKEVLGVSVTCDDGDQRRALGAILLYDKVDSGYGIARLGSEERQIAISFASMLGAVIGARHSAELGKELSMAQAIQAQILPAAPAKVAGFDLAGDYRTSGDVGGDYFDYVPLADGRTLAVIADVSGHNLASGMMMVSARATLRTLAAVRTDPVQLFADLAHGMFTDLTRTERFITAAGVALQPRDGTVEIVNAGHNDLLLYRAADGSVTRLASESTVFGFLPRASYDRLTVRLDVGDCLLLYTDGVTEATDADLEMFGDERLIRVLADAARLGARDVVGRVIAAVQDFRDAGERGDDVTVLAIKRTADAHGERA